MTANGGQPTVRLGQAGSMPLVGLGTWQMTGARCRAAVRSALEVGYRHLDTATMYRNEREVGRAVRDSGVPREQLFITTKLPPGAAGREQRTLPSSLRALGVDYVDLWLVHWPPRGRALVSTWKELLAVRHQGLARAVGVSNYRPAQLDKLIDAWLAGRLRTVCEQTVRILLYVAAPSVATTQVRRTIADASVCPGTGWWGSNPGICRPSPSAKRPTDFTPCHVIALPDRRMPPSRWHQSLQAPRAA
jgi:diketogulonate reductase-like aldo/keto reductase